MMGVFGQLIFAFMALVTAGFIVGYGFARLIGSNFRKLYYNRTYHDKPIPLYSMVEARIKTENFDEAIELLEDIVEENPGDPEPFIKMIEVAIKHKDDPEQAEFFYMTAVTALTNEDSLQKLNAMYNAMKKWRKEEKEQADRDSKGPVDLDQ